MWTRQERIYRSDALCCSDRTKINDGCFSLQVTVNWFQLQQAQVVSLPVNNQSLCENAKLYEPGQRYTEFVRNLPTDGPRLESHSFDSAVTQNTG